MKVMKTLKIEFVDVEQVNDLAVQTYRKVKNEKTEIEKDMLLERLLKDTSIAEALKSCEAIPKMQRKVVSEWVGSEREASPVDSAIQCFNTFIKKSKPNFIGFSKQEILLIFAIKGLEEDNIHVYANTDGIDLMCWIVCKHKDYDLLDRVSDLITKHEFDHRTYVEWIFMSENQYANSCAPEFAFYF